MAQPGSFANAIKGEDWLVRRVQDLERSVQQLAAANPFGLTQMKPRDGGTDFDGFVNINGPAKITGTLELPAGIIGNDALTSPVQIGTATNGIGSYAITTTSTVRASVTLTVPDGFSQAVVLANPTAMGFNSTASADYLYAQAIIQTINGGEIYTSAPAGVGVGLASPFQITLSDLTDGEAITVSVATRTNTATWAASTGNQANIYALAYFLR